jgi:transposase
MRTIGIDLAIVGDHKAVILDDRSNPIGKVFRLQTDPTSLETLLRCAREGTGEDEPLRAVMEPTGLAWVSVASYLIQRGVTVYLVNTQQVADLRKFYKKHAKSDRIDARVLARLPWVNPDTLHSLQLPPADYLSGQRWCKQQEELDELMTAIKNRVQAWERGFWPGLEQVVGNLFAPWVCRWREEWYDPWQLQEAETAQLAAFLAQAGADPEKVDSLAISLQQVAQQAIALFGTPEDGPSPHVDYATLQDQVLRELRLLAFYQDEHQALRRKLQKLYRQLHPERHLESIKGVGDNGAAVYLFFIGDIARFATQKDFRGWHGMIPSSQQSSDTEKKGLRITCAGPDPVKKYGYINADVARQWDPQLAAIYYEQMVHKGNHHCQAVCACATHLLDRVRAVLRDGRPYELRDVDGRPVTWQEARVIIAERYHVPDEVRKRNSSRARKARRDQRAEKKQRRRSRPGSERLTP